MLTPAGALRAPEVVKMGLDLVNWTWGKLSNFMATPPRAAAQRSAGPTDSLTKGHIHQRPLSSPLFDRLCTVRKT